MASLAIFSKVGAFQERIINSTPLLTKKWVNLSPVNVGEVLKGK